MAAYNYESGEDARHTRGESRRPTKQVRSTTRRTTTHHEPTIVADPVPRRNVVSIDAHATAPDEIFSVGDRVTIGGTGLYAGESATVEATTMFNGTVPGASVRTDAGKPRMIRFSDLVRAE
jgi:hypothetical protein